MVIGGGLRKSRIDEIAIGRAAVQLKASGCNAELQPSRNHRRRIMGTGLGNERSRRRLGRPASQKKAARIELTLFRVT